MNTASKAVRITAETHPELIREAKEGLKSAPSFAQAMRLTGFTATPLRDAEHDAALREYCRRDAELCMRVQDAIGLGRFSLWSPPAYVAQHPERVHVAPDGTQHHYKT